MSDMDRYNMVYDHMGDRVVSILTEVQRRHACLLPFDFMIVSQAYGMSGTACALDYHIPWAYREDAETRKAILKSIQKATLIAIGEIYPQFRSVNVYADGMMVFRVTSYGFAIVSKLGQFG